MFCRQRQGMLDSLRKKVCGMCIQKVIHAVQQRAKDRKEENKRIARGSEAEHKREILLCGKGVIVWLSTTRTE